MAIGMMPALAHDRGQLAEFGDSLVQGVGELLAVADVGLDRHAAPALLLDELLGVHEVVLTGHRVRVGLDVLADVDAR